MKTRIHFANTAEAHPGALVAFVNEIVIGDDGWAMICPIGDFPSSAYLPNGKGGFKTEPAIQRIDKRAVDLMAANFHNSRKGFRKYLRGVPIYIGHPDVPGLERKYPDKTPRGVFADVQAREDGLFGLPVFTNEGSDLVEKKVLRALSGNIGNSEPDGKKGNLPVYRPTELFSVGLTNDPHLPVQYLNNAEANAAAEQKQNMKKKLIELLALAGITLKDDADDAATEAALDQFGPKVKAGLAFANEKQTLTQKVTGLETDKTTLTTERDTARQEVTTVRTQFANERNAHIKTLLDTGVGTGRITEAERSTWDGRLKVEANFANESTSLLALEPKVKTAHATGGRTSANVDTETPAGRRQFLNDAIASICKEKGLDPVKDYDKAFQIAQRTHGALFANMQQPEIAGRKTGKKA